MTAVRRIDLVTARRLAILKQRLAGRAPRSSPARVLDVARSIRCVQLDPISVVARSPLLVLRSRLDRFDPAHLDRLLWRDRALFEYWAHAASIVLTEDYAIHRYRMRNYPSKDDGWGTRFGDLGRTQRRPAPVDPAEPSTQRPDAGARLRRQRGLRQLGLVRVDRRPQRQPDAPVPVVAGEVLVADRRGLEKWWDLGERVLPAEACAERIGDLEVTRRAAQRSLRALGVATPLQIRSHFTIGRYPQLPRVLAELERRSAIERVEVESMPGTWYVHRDDLPALERLERGSWSAADSTLLSPFDNLIHDRKRAAALHDLDYRMEIYVPKAKRRFGYYAMPLLHGDRFVARVDSAVDRERSRLVVHAVHPEDGTTPSRALGPVVAGAIE